MLAFYKDDGGLTTTEPCWAKRKVLTRSYDLHIQIIDRDSLAVQVQETVDAGRIKILAKPPQQDQGP